MTPRNATAGLAVAMFLGCHSDAEIHANDEVGGTGGNGGGSTGLECPASEQELLDNSDCLLESWNAASPRCSYPGSGCPHDYACMPTVNSPAPNGGWYGRWTLQPPTVAGACEDAGTVCSYAFGTCGEGCVSGSTQYTCTDAHQWAVSFEEECTSCGCCDPCPASVPMAGAPCNPSYATVLTCTYHEVDTGCGTRAVCNQGSWVLEPLCR